MYRASKGHHSGISDTENSKILITEHSVSLTAFRDLMHIFESPSRQRKQAESTDLEEHINLDTKNFV